MRRRAPAVTHSMLCGWEYGTNASGLAVHPRVHLHVIPTYASWLKGRGAIIGVSISVKTEH